MTIHEFLQGDKFALLAGVELLETGNGYAKARMLIKPEHLNGGGVCQGGVRMDKDHHQITLAYFEQRSTVDYIGAVQGIPVCFDAKAWDFRCPDPGGT